MLSVHITILETEERGVASDCKSCDLQIPEDRF